MHLFDTYLALESRMHSPEQITHLVSHAFSPLLAHCTLSLSEVLSWQ